MSKSPEPNPNFTKVYTAHGQVEANLIQSRLEAAGIQVLKFQESAGAVYGFTMGELGHVDLWVPAERKAEAEALIAEMNG
jgi:hypothetical protein